MELSVTWSTLKTLVSGKSLNMQFVEEASNYFVFAQEGAVLYFTNIRRTSPASADQTDFDNNYKSSANAAIQSTPISGSFSFNSPRYRPKIQTAYTDVTLTDSLQTIISVTGEGKVDFINIRFSKEDVELAVWVDGAQQYLVDLEDIDDELGLDDGLKKGHPVGVENSGKTYVEKFSPPADFTTSFEVKARKTGRNPKFLAGLIKYRIKI